jgi:NADPH-dependent 2,4-dienoyl-CoA reductase/sulfur reductase-like enzyme
MATTRYVIIGGGVASAKAAVAIRALDTEGTVTLVCGENRFPYDKPPLSKNFLTNDAMTEEDPESKDPSWYEKNNVEVRKGIWIDRIDREAKTIQFGDEGVIEYDRLLLTTGSSPIRPSIPGIHQENVCLLRTLDDAVKIRNLLHKAKHVALLGGGYIGLEVAASALTRGVPCTIINHSPGPWSRFASPKAGDFVKRRLEKEGARVLYHDEVTNLHGDGVVTGLSTEVGREVHADVVVVGAGVRLNTALAETSGLKLAQTGGVVVNDHFQTSDPDIYAAGDIAAFIDPYTGELGHAEHYMNGNWQGEAAGSSMAGGGKPWDKVNYFFSDMLDIHMALRGSPGGELAKVLGSYETGDFIELYANQDGTLRMALIVDREEKKLDPISDQVEAAIMKRSLVEEVHLDMAAVSS